MNSNLENPTAVTVNKGCIEESDESEMPIGSKAEILENNQVSQKRRKIFVEQVVGSPKPIKQESCEESATIHESEPNIVVKKEVPDCELTSVQRVRPHNLEDGEFNVEAEWVLVGSTLASAVSTSKGMKLLDNEIVHFAFPSPNSTNKTQWIVRFSTNRSGEIGRFPMEWAKTVVPLVNSGKVKVLGRYMGVPKYLSMMQDIMLSVSYYVHHSTLTAIDMSSRKLGASPNICYLVSRLFTVIGLLKLQPVQKCAEESKEEANPESSVNNIDGAADLHNVEEMEPLSPFTNGLTPYQKQTLYWMLELEKGVGAHKSAHTLHPCWDDYRISDKRASSIYVNMFTGEVTTHFPTAPQMPKGGILADAAGLGKTMITAALILARPRRETSDSIDITKKRKTDPDTVTSLKPKGGTLVVCPRKSQWKDAFKAHSESKGISIFVCCGSRLQKIHPKEFSKHDIVLTDYDDLVDDDHLDYENSIFHQVDWYRVVLDEAHSLASSEAKEGAHFASTLSSHCRWWLTGIPLKVDMENIYSILRFLHVEPWSNHACWKKLIQMPYEREDPIGLRLIKDILRPLMLRKTKEAKDEDGRPILVLPPNIETIECHQFEAEHEVYDDLFRTAKVQFDQFVAQGKILSNYKTILELLFRLRQCCSHPFLVLSRSNSGNSADLGKLSKNFLETNLDSPSSDHSFPTQAHVENAVQRKDTWCPLCMDFPDDPVLTKCEHKMCRECLFSRWRRQGSPAGMFGQCPICHHWSSKKELDNCTSGNCFQVCVEEDWMESTKVSKLLDILEHTHQSNSCAKSIIFSQWSSFFDLLEISMKRRGIQFLRIDRNQSKWERERVVDEFTYYTRNKMVLLVCLKTEVLDLDLSAASTVFLMDPWLNPAAEERALMNIVRSRQKPTVVKRFVVKNTIEERMQELLSTGEEQYFRQDLKNIFR